MAYLKVQTSNSTYSFLVTNAAPAKPYLPIVSGAVTSYLPLVTKTSTHAGMKLQVVSGTSSYRNMFQDNKSSGTTWNTSSNATNSKLSSTTALTKATTTGTKYATGTSTTLTKYATGTSTTGTKYATGTSTTLTKYATGTSTTLTKYATGTSTTGTKYATGTITTGTKYASKTTTTGTKYATGTITTGTNYGTKKSTLNYTSTIWDSIVSMDSPIQYRHVISYGSVQESSVSSYAVWTDYRFSGEIKSISLSKEYTDFNKPNLWFSVSVTDTLGSIVSVTNLSSNFLMTCSFSNPSGVTATRSTTWGGTLLATKTTNVPYGRFWTDPTNTRYYNATDAKCPAYSTTGGIYTIYTSGAYRTFTEPFGTSSATTTGGYRKYTFHNWAETKPYNIKTEYWSQYTNSSTQYMSYWNETANPPAPYPYYVTSSIITLKWYEEVRAIFTVNSRQRTGTYTANVTTGTTYLTTTKTSTPITYQTTTRTTTPLTYQTTTKTSTPITYNTKTVTSTPITYSTKTVTSTPITYSTKTVTSTPITYNTKTVTSTPITYSTKTVTSTPITYNTTNVTTGYSGKVSSGSSWTIWG